MSIRTSPWPAGVPCWVDLSVADVAAAQAFYAAVLGWSFDPPDPASGGYVIAEVEGAAAAGIGPMASEGQPAAWTLYLASDDADETAEAVVAAGGSVLLPPGDVGPFGRMLVAADPTGAPFGVWQAGTHVGAGVVNQPGGLTWEDLRSSDPDAARAFYVAVFGFRIDPVPMAGPDYATFALPADPQTPLGGIGGMMGIEGMPSHWLVYFGVADAAAAAAATERAGGVVVAPPFDTPYGRMAGLVDPAGALFWVVETSGSGQPDRSG